MLWYKLNFPNFSSFFSWRSNKKTNKLLMSISLQQLQSSCYHSIQLSHRSLNKTSCRTVDQRPRETGSSTQCDWNQSSSDLARANQGCKTLSSNLGYHLNSDLKHSFCRYQWDVWDAINAELFQVYNKQLITLSAWKSLSEFDQENLRPKHKNQIPL